MYIESVETLHIYYISQTSCHHSQLFKNSKARIHINYILNYIVH